METLDAETPIKDLVDRVERWVHSRVPVVENDDADRVIGLAHRREVLDTALRQPEDELVVRDLIRPIRFVPGSKPANELLALFIEDRTHMVAVVDEYGGIDGLVTLEDVLECMLGADIVDEYDMVDNMRVHALERRTQHVSDEDAEDKSEETDARDDGVD